MATILFADDDAEIRLVISLMLERVGNHTVVVARDGQEVLDLAPQVKPDLILLDLNMPVMDGWTAARTLKSMPDLAATPIVAVTAHGAGTEGARALAAGCSEIITKPVDMAAFLLQVASFLPPAPYEPANR